MIVLCQCRAVNTETGTSHREKVQLQVIRFNEAKAKTNTVSLSPVKALECFIGVVPGLRRAK